MNSTQTYCAVVLAADRGDPADPLAAYSKGANKCLIDVAGRPMIAWVLRTLLSAAEIGEVLISTNDLDLLERVPGFEAERAAGRLRVVAAGPNLFASVEAALRADGVSRCPAIITTADNPLLTTTMLTHFCRETRAQRGDAAIAMTRAEVMRAEHPDGQRRFYAFSDGEFSNCNLFALMNTQAVGAAEMFKGGGQFRKKALRIVRAFGLLNFLRYKLRMLSLARVGERLSAIFGTRVVLVTMPFAEACIDVDNERTLLLARAVLTQRYAS